jgi:hypothetical protein
MFDDVMNRTNTSASLHAKGLTLGGVIGDQIWLWMTRQDRFSTLSVAWGYSVFYVFESRLAYKLLLAVILVAALVAAGSVLRSLTGRWDAFGVFVCIAAGTLQILGWGGRSRRVRGAAPSHNRALPRGSSSCW